MLSATAEFRTLLISPKDSSDPLLSSWPIEQRMPPLSAAQVLNLQSKPDSMSVAEATNTTGTVLGSIAQVPIQARGGNDTITVNTGTYEATESTLITRPMAARYQSYVGGHAEWDYQIEGDTLVLKLKTEVSSDGVSYIQEGASFTRTLKRLE